MQTALGVGAAVLPLAGFAVQYRQTRKDKRDSYSTAVALLVIVAQIGGLLFYASAGEAIEAGTAATCVVAVAVQLALLELVTRLRREQRMLPSSCYLRISFRWKYLQRYFWQWDDFPSYLYFLAVLVVALLGWAGAGRIIPGVAEGLGALAAAAAAAQGAPQWWRNRREGVEGLSRIAVGLWLAGAATSVLSELGGDAARLATLRLVAAAVNVVVLAGVAYQLVAYRHKFKSHDF